MAKDGGAHTGILAERLGLAPGTVTATVKRLADRGLVDHEPYHGVELTVAGRQLAIAARRPTGVSSRLRYGLWSTSPRSARRLTVDVTVPGVRPRRSASAPVCAPPSRESR